MTERDELRKNPVADSTAQHWSPIETAPKDRKIDLWAKHWLASRDEFAAERFPDCRWWNKDVMGSWDEHWHGLPKGWRATHWMDIPDGPSL
jgi:hypothetical protein